ncbi:MAG: TetR/AcrR family transcriptional regulator [Myxococcota bacterium]
MSAVLAATLDELAAHGTDGVSIDRIAKAADVNKTTVYRRWATREELVAAALESALHGSTESLSDCGSLRADLVQLVEQQGRFVSTSAGQAIARAAMSSTLADAIRQRMQASALRQPAEIVGLIERAVKRGEWDLSRTPPEVLFAMLGGAVIQRVLMERSPTDEAWCASLVELAMRAIKGGDAR